MHPLPPAPKPTFDLDAFLVEFALAAAERGFRSETIANIAGDPVQVWTRPAASIDAPRAFLSAGIHGDEPAGPLATLRFFQQYRLPHAIDWVVAPALNPSGLRRGSRDNAEGIDLNRDFLRQRANETRALAAWWQSQARSCDLHLSLHEDWETAGFYFYAINSGPRPCFSTLLQQSLEQVLPLQQTGPVDGHELLKPGLIAHPCQADEPEGWPEAIWLATRHPTLSYTFEAPSSLPLPDRVNALCLALQTALALAQTPNPPPQPPK